MKTPSFVRIYAFFLLGCLFAFMLGSLLEGSGIPYPVIRWIALSAVFGSLFASLIYSIKAIWELNRKARIGNLGVWMLVLAILIILYFLPFLFLPMGVGAVM